MRSNFLCLSSILSIILFFFKSASCNQHLDSNRREILELHTKYRQDLVDCKVDGQPPAKYMSPLKWNYNLAAQAQKLANKCILQHDKRHSDEFSWVGQNIALHPTIKSGVDAWFNEHKLYDYNQNNCMKCLHYTQMVWAKTTDIGCGVASCPTYGLSIVCNYGPGGNWNNEKPYELKSRELCPKMQNIRKDSFQMMRDDTPRAPLSKVNVNHKLSSIGSSEGLVNDQPSTGVQRTLDSNRREILELHTKYRQDLVDCKVDGQPPAKYMSPLKWNYNLAAQAQKLANKCILQHDKRHSDEFSWVGQNIALHPTIKSGVDAWFNEHKLYDYNQNNCMKCLHYTQMVWAKTTDIGCGVASCPTYGLSIVCNYGPGGNWNNEKPYELKSRELCPKMQNIRKDSFQMMRDDTPRAPLSKVNVNHKLSSIGSSEGLVNDQPSTGVQRTLDSNRREILELHTKYRQDLVDCKVDGQPPAKYMSPLKWNYNLAAQAQKLANKCILQHDKRHSDEFSWVGQNIALHPTIKSGVDAWFNEHKLYDYNQNNCMKCLHYTQMVWAKTTDIGCGVASCPTYGLSIVCNYGPGGNWNNEKPYELKSRELCPKMQNIRKDSFQMMRDDTPRAPLSKVNVNHKLSSIGSSEGLVNDQPSTGVQRTLDSNRREILELHTKYRQDLVDCKVDGQPPAKYMSPLKWNYNLAAQAQKLANKCILQHDKRHSDEFSWVGQNIALHPTIKSGVDAWFNEHKLYDYNQNNCMKCLHYTQMVWAKTTDIGCGVASCPTYGLSIVCNYGPGGNWNNEKPYELKSRELCPKMQNIRKDSFQMMRDDTPRAPLSKVNVNHKLSSIGSSVSRVHYQRIQGQPISINNFQHSRRNTQRKWSSGTKALHKFSKSVRCVSGHGNDQRQQNCRIVRY
ncbi:unnamed protein product [Schistosoma guineensis]|nr:unnamed protein product [Schistosoma guineensis]